MKLKKAEIKRRTNVLEKILIYYEGHKERMGFYPRWTADQIKLELDLQYKDIKFLLENSNSISHKIIKNIKRCKNKITNNLQQFIS